MSFRRLSGVEIEDVQAAHLREIGERWPREAIETFSSLKKLADAEEQKSIELTPGEDGQYEMGDRAAKAAVQAADPLGGYSVRKLLRYGIVSWRGKNGEISYEGIEPSEEHKDELDKETRRWAALQVLELSVITEGEVESSVLGTGQTNGTEPTRLTALASSGAES